MTARFSAKDLVAWAASREIRIARQEERLLEMYLERLLFWNRRMSLVSQDHPDEIRCKHFADSLGAAALCSEGESVVDIGTGAGFPGLPIAILRPGCPVLLVESNRKKVSFLLDVVSHLDLRNATVAETRAEAGPFVSAQGGKHSVVISRAFSAIPDFLRIALPLLRPGGRALAMKGPNYEAELADPAIVALGAVLLGETPYSLPDGSRRVILAFGANPL